MSRGTDSLSMGTGNRLRIILFVAVFLVILPASAIAESASPEMTGNAAEVTDENLTSPGTTASPTPPLSAITIYGKVTDMFGKPIPNATVTALSSLTLNGIPQSDSTLTSEDGSYRLEQVVGHRQNISVRKEGYPTKSWNMYFDKLTNEFNMHIDIDRSTSPDTDTETPVPDTLITQINKNPVIQGDYFSVLISGRPETSYYLWVKGTRAMTGTWGDSPPQISSGAYQDRITGPFRFGSYEVYMGNGSTILNEVPQMTHYNDPTKYYGTVLTDESGKGSVGFYTSLGTKPGDYTIRVERGNISDEATVRIEPMQTIPLRVKGYGTVWYLPIEGGFYGIVSETGGHYDPLNLPEDFQMDGLPVSFEAITKPEHLSFHMWGTPVELIRIENISPATAAPDSQDGTMRQPLGENASPSFPPPNSSTRPSPLPGWILVTAIGIAFVAWGYLRKK